MQSQHLAAQLRQIGFKAHAVSDTSIEIRDNSRFAVKSGLNQIFGGLTDKPEFEYSDESFGTVISWQ